VPYADLADPQSLNQYSYVRNIPTSKTDPDGHQCPWCPAVERVVEEVAESPAGQQIIQNGAKAITGIGAGVAAGWAWSKGYFKDFVNNLGSSGEDVAWQELNRQQDALRREEEQKQQDSQANSNDKSTPADPNQQSDKDQGRNSQAGNKKSTTPTGQSSSGQKTNAYGEKLGGSGKPQRHSAQHSTRKAAKDAARQDGKTAPQEDNGHFHSTDKNGRKVHNGTHHEYPH
jgi:hypothetical protein